jgi:hypothetical protein
LAIAFFTQILQLVWMMALKVSHNMPSIVFPSISFSCKENGQIKEGNKGRCATEGSVKVSLRCVGVYP